MFAMTSPIPDGRPRSARGGGCGDAPPGAALPGIPGAAWAFVLWVDTMQHHTRRLRTCTKSCDPAPPPLVFRAMNAKRWSVLGSVLVFALACSSGKANGSPGDKDKAKDPDKTKVTQGSATVAPPAGDN